MRAPTPNNHTVFLYGFDAINRYNLFDWPTRPQSNLVVIGIANTMDMDERLLKRIASRLGLTKIQFKPYSKDQLVSIIKVRSACCYGVILLLQILLSASNLLQSHDA